MNPNKMRDEIRAAAYKSMLKVNPNVINTMVKLLQDGTGAKDIEKWVLRKYKAYGNNNLTINALILAAYHMEANPETYKDPTQ